MLKRALPNRIDLLAYDWTRAQALQYLLNPLARDGNLMLAWRLAPAHIPHLPPYDKNSPVIERQFQHLQSIRVLGYRPEMIAREAYHDELGCRYAGTDITVELDREGDIVLVDGGHRLLYLLIAGARQIPAVVRYRHPEWLAFVEAADAIAGGYTYAQLPHPDFADCPTGRTESRVPMVYEAIKDLWIRSAVDIGACSGAFACDLAAIVPDVLGIEREPAFIKLARWRAGKAGNCARFEHGELLDWHGEADLVSCLSVLHHVVEASGADAVRAWLTDLRCRYLLIEYPTPGEPWLEGRPAAAAFGLNLTCDLTRAGYTLEADLGRDHGFPATARNVSLWRKNGA